MADEQVNDAGIPETSTGETQGSTVAEKSEPQTIDLRALPEFREWQAKQDKRIAEMSLQLTQAQTAIDAERTKGMTETERLQYQLKKQQDQIGKYEQELQAQRLQQQRQTDLQKLADLSGAPMGLLDAASTYDDAVELALKHSTAAQAEKVRAEERKNKEREAANTTDVGGGGSAPAPDEDEERKKLIESRDARGYAAYITRAMYGGS